MIFCGNPASSRLPALWEDGEIRRDLVSVTR
jgi:hypothetical protein